MATLNQNVTNLQTITSGGVTVNAPLVALAYSFAVINFVGVATNAGARYTITCGGHSITITLNSSGRASVSLLPFIRNAVRSSGVLDDPMYCTNTTYIANNFRGSISVSVQPSGGTATSMTIYYIFGNYAPKAVTVRDVYLDYDANGETWANVDAISMYDSNGVPNDFNYNWCNINSLVSTPPTGDFDLALDVAWFYGSSVYKFRTITYHFRYDCRTENVIKLRWLDQNGNINCKKFVLAGRSHGGAPSASWKRPHTTKSLVHGVNPYDRGRDEWANITASETIAIGDECLPIAQFDWLKTLTSSAIIECYKDASWVRCNIGDASVECDPRKAQFSISLTLIFPTDDVQQF